MAGATLTAIPSVRSDIKGGIVLLQHVTGKLALRSPQAGTHAKLQWKWGVSD